MLGWRPALDIGEAVSLTAAWYREYHATPSAARLLTLRQIEDYRHKLHAHASTHQAQQAPANDGAPL